MRHYYPVMIVHTVNKSRIYFWQSLRFFSPSLFLYSIGKEVFAWLISSSNSAENAGLQPYKSTSNIMNMDCTKSRKVNLHQLPPKIVKETQEASSQRAEKERTGKTACKQSKCDQRHLVRFVEWMPMGSGEAGIVPGVQQHFAWAVSDLAGERSFR